VPERPIRQQLHEAAEPPPNEASLQAKLFYLRNELALSDILDAIALCAPTKSDTERNAALRFTTSSALESVLGFLKAAGFSSLTLERLLQALRELGEGHVHPLVTPPKIAHRRADSFSTLGCKAVAAAAMHLHMDAGESKDQAASKVVKALRNTPFRYYGGKPISPRAIASWRDRCIGSHDKADAAAYIFKAMLAAMRSRFSNPTKQAEGVLAVLARISPRSPESR
jgi:hypothetical protein